MYIDSIDVQLVVKPYDFRDSGLANGELQPSASDAEAVVLLSAFSLAKTIQTKHSCMYKELAFSGRILRKKNTPR